MSGDAWDAGVLVCWWRFAVVVGVVASMVANNDDMVRTW